MVERLFRRCYYCLHIFDCQIFAVPLLELTGPDPVPVRLLFEALLRLAFNIVLWLRAFVTSSAPDHRHVHMLIGLVDYELFCFFNDSLS